MKRRFWTFAFCLLSGLMLSFQARADIEALQALITGFGDVKEGAEEKILTLKSKYESFQQLVSQVKKAANEAKETIDKGKQAYASVEEKAKAIRAQAENVVDAIKNKDISALGSNFSNKEFAGLKNTFNGTKDDDEMADAVLDTLVRKRGSNSISVQKALSAAINLKNCSDIADLFAKSMMTRQNLAAEKDDVKDPQTVEEAIELTQKTNLDTMRRQDNISLMNDGVARFKHTRALETVTGSYEKEENNE